MLIQCCLNGSRELAEHPALPDGPEAAAAEAAAAVEAGAGAFHVHPRDAEGRESVGAEAVASWLEAIRDACPGVPVGVSTWAGLEALGEARLSAIESWRDPVPDYVSVNLYEDGAHEIALACLERGVGVEAAVGGPADVERLVETQLERRCLRVLVEALCEPVDQPDLIAEIDAALDDREVATPRLYYGDAEGTWVVVRDALERGRDVRIGLEDVLTLPDGSEVTSNAELIAAVRALAVAADGP